MTSPSHQRLTLALALVALLLGGSFALRQRAAGDRSPMPRPVRPAAAAALLPASPQHGSGASAAAVPEASFAADQLLAFVQPTDAATLNATLRAPATEVRYVRINPDLIEGKQSPFWQPDNTGRLVLPLPDGGEATIVIQGSESLGARRFTSAGRIEGRPDSRAIFAYNEGFLHAHVEDPDLGEYELRAATEQVEQYYKVDPAQLKSCGGEIAPIIDADALAEVARRKLAAASQPGPAGHDAAATPAIEAASVGANVQIDLLMLYTQAVLPTISGAQRTAAIQSAIDAAVAQLNSDLPSSLAQARIRLVRTAQVNYPGDEQAVNDNTGTANWQSNMLTRLRGTADGFMDEIHALRDQVGADLVCLSQWRFDTTSSGIAYTVTVGEFDHATNPLFGFSVVQYDYMTTEHVFSHEIGHNLGCTHNRENSSGQGAFSYSYGYRLTAANGRKYRDIMSYDTSPASYTFLPYFSTPLVTPTASGASIGSPIGIAAGQAGESDCARSIDQVAFEVSTYRLQQQAPATNGTLYAVSTRAFVGTAPEQQLIGAFIVSGPAGSTKRMLVRGNGPALSGAVTNFLPNPKLTLFRVDVSPSVIIAENDDWGSNANAAAIATAGGTAAAAGSRDAALLVDLPPGIYTANVTSSDGSTGTALVEAYEVTTAGTKVTALSTRGYSSTDQVMIAGFIVNGAAGTTKRIVIRGQGPNLARQGVSGAMNDPYLELYNSTSDRVLINDDWAAQNVGTSSDDFRPQAVLYSELQIQAAGMAPANRREPCIMVDLTPGVYTAILKPFQLSATTAGSPGVALIEVYEIP